MADTRTAIVWNPAKTSRDELERALPEAAREAALTWHETSPDDAGSAATDEALTAGAGAVVAAGGDGTVRAVAERLADHGREVDLAVVPLGTGNLLARNLDIPVGDLEGALERAFTGTPRAIDLGWVDAVIEGRRVRRSFSVMAGFGIDAHMIVETDEDLKSKVGWLAYVESLGRALRASEPVGLDIALDGAEPERTTGHTLLVGNCGTLQGGIRLLPDADPADGRLDLLLLSANGLAQWLETLRAFVWDNGVRRLLGGDDRAPSAETLTYARTRAVSVALAQARVIEIDGEDLGETTAFTIGLRPAAVRVR